jgi:protein involved in polysaccharide export with SLBB domain
MAATDLGAEVANFAVSNKKERVEVTLSGVWFRAGRLPAILASTVLVLIPAALRAQLPTGAAELAQQCNGPLGSLLPECQAAKGAMDLPAGRRLPADLSVPALRMPASKPTAAPSQPPRETSVEPPPPQPVTEFQRFAASSVGQVLPIFGANLFEHVPTTFAPLDRVPVTSDYVIGPGDELLLRAWGQISIDLELTVDRAGAVFIPQVGNISVSGLQFQQVPGFLRSRIERVYRNFDLNVNMGQLRSVEILVVGQVRRPGSYTVSSLSTLVNALFASGGPSAQGSMRHIQLKRNAQVATEFDLYDLLLKGDKSKDLRLLPGDVVYVPPAGPQVAVAGSVRNPAIYELHGEATAGELIQMAGGLSAVADGQHATLERIQQRNSLVALEFPLDQRGLATGVGDGDVLHVLAVTPRFSNVITLRGNVANPGRFPWREGMHLRDVIPDKESLVTREYWNKRNVLGFAPQESAVAAVPVTEARRKPATTTLGDSVPDINWSYAVIERQNPRDLSTELLPFHLGKLVLERDDSQNLELRQGDVVTVFSQADIRVSVSQQKRMVRLEGEFHSAGIYAVRPGETLGQLVQRVGGLTSQAYLFGAEFLRESTRADQQRRLDEFVGDLEKEVEQTSNLHMGSASTQEETSAIATKLESERRLVERMRSIKATGRIVLNLEPGENNLDRLMDLTLEDSDRFVVPARPATVNVLGAVYNQNAFVHENGLRIADYLRQAGGATRNADKGHTFIIRADGSVVPKQGSGPFKQAFETARLNPGDSVVVPEAIFKTTFLKGLRDWTQVFTQFALGAAAINILR